MPEFSIILPAYNYARYQSESIQSILSQSLEDFELIVIDDASTDDTWDRILSMDDSRLIPVRHDTNAGLASTLNHGLDLAQGTYVAAVSADDRIHPDFLRMLSATFHEASEQVGALTTYVQVIDGKGQPVPGHPAEKDTNRIVQYDDISNWIWHNPFNSGAAVRKSVLDFVGGFTPGRTVAPDWDLWIRILAAGFVLRAVRQPLYQWRAHGENITNRNALHLVDEYSLISESHLHPYLMRLDRHDLVAQNVAGFLGHEALTDADPDVVGPILRRVTDSVPEADVVHAVQILGSELGRLREYYVADAARLQEHAAQADQLRSDLQERTFELNATLDRWVAAEQDRRVALATVEKWQRSPIVRAARKAKRTLRRDS